MSGERLLASFIVRILLRDGQRLVRVHDVARGTRAQFCTYRELVEHFVRSEEQGGSGSPDETSRTEEAGG